MGILKAHAEVNELVRGILWDVGGLGVVVVVGKDGDARWFDVRSREDSGNIRQGVGESSFNEWIARYLC